MDGGHGPQKPLHDKIFTKSVPLLSFDLRSITHLVLGVNIKAWMRDELLSLFDILYIYSGIRNEILYSNSQFVAIVQIFTYYMLFEFNSFGMLRAPNAIEMRGNMAI